MQSENSVLKKKKKRMLSKQMELQSHGKGTFENVDFNNVDSIIASDITKTNF
jgi:hypothetical protein